MARRRPVLSLTRRIVNFAFRAQTSFMGGLKEIIGGGEGVFIALTARPSAAKTSSTG